MTLRAACLCGATCYELDGDIGEIHLCYCSQCRRANGGAFNVAVIVESANVRFLKRDKINEFEHTPGKFRAFCGGCGSPIYSRRTDLPELMRLRGGLIEDLPEPKRLTHGFVEHRWHWLDN